MLTYILALLCSAVIIAADQFTKYYILANFSMYDAKPFIKGIINITYVENNGGAWGVLGGYTWILLAVTAVIMIICITLLVKKGSKNPYFFWTVCIILAGGLGNMIDRIFRGGNVVDFLQFDFWRTFPVFNIADCAIVVGCVMLILYFAFDSLSTGEKTKAAKDEK